MREAGVDDDTTVAVSKAYYKKKKQMGAVAGAAIDRTNIRLINRDFRLVSQQDVADGSVDLVVALAFLNAKIPEDEGGRIHEQLMESASRWLKEGAYLQCRLSNGCFLG